MARKLAAVLMAASLTLAACGSEEEAPQAPGNDRLGDKTWQAIGIYTSPDAPAITPDPAAEPPTISFGNNAAVGTTGCARFRADVRFTAHNKPAYVEDADSLSFGAIEFDSKDESCEGEAAWAHARLTQLFAEGNEFGITVDSKNQLVMTLRDGQVDSPSIRFASF